MDQLLIKNLLIKNLVGKVLLIKNLVGNHPQMLKISEVVILSI
tara:strand:+ start:164 stop:292 length:129 start_codon:yes stop_codon:yes gene_type:complete